MNAPVALLAAFADEACPLAAALADYRAATLRLARLEYLRETDELPDTAAACERAAADEKPAKAAAIKAVAEFYGVEVASDWESSIGVTDWSKGRAA